MTQRLDIQISSKNKKAHKVKDSAKSVIPLSFFTELVDQVDNE
jgi:hypothetical protein